MELLLSCYLTGLLVIFILATYGIKHEKPEVPQWLIMFACVIWPITLCILMWSIVFDKPKTSK